MPKEEGDREAHRKGFFRKRVLAESGRDFDGSGDPASRFRIPLFPNTKSQWGLGNGQGFQTRSQTSRNGQEYAGSKPDEPQFVQDPVDGQGFQGVHGATFVEEEDSANDAVEGVGIRGKKLGSDHDGEKSRGQVDCQEA